MNLHVLRNLITKNEKRFVLGRLIESNGSKCEVVGIVQKKDKLVLVTTHVVEKRDEQLYDMSTERLSYKNRYIMHNQEEEMDRWPLKHVGKVIIDDKSFEVRSKESRRVLGYEWESVIELYEFMKLGWSPEWLENVYAEQLFVTYFELEGDDARDLKLSANSKIVFEERPYVISRYVGLPMSLQISEDYPDKLWFKDERSGEAHWVQVNRVFLMDVHTEMLKMYENPELSEKFNDAQIIKMRAELESRLLEVCPRGMYFPVVEYECFDDDISLQFFAQSYLDEKQKNNGAIGFITGADKMTGKLGNKLKACVIQTPVTEETSMIDVELFGYSRVVRSVGMIS